MSIDLKIGTRVPKDTIKDKYKLKVTVYDDDTCTIFSSSDFVFSNTIKNLKVLKDLLEAFTAFKAQEPTDLNLENDDQYYAQYNFLCDFKDNDKDWIDTLNYYRMSNLYVESLSVTYYDLHGDEYYVNHVVF